MTSTVPKLASWLAHNGKESLKFHGVAIIVDIMGFTALTERFSQLGKTGAETVSRALSLCLGGIIQAIHVKGGDIFQFAGDSLLAVFPDIEKSAAKHLAETVEREYAATMFSDEILQKPKVRISAVSGQITLTLHEYGGKTVWISGGLAVEHVYKLDEANDASEINYNLAHDPDPSETAAAIMIAESLAQEPPRDSGQEKFFDGNSDPRSERNAFRNVLTVFARFNSSGTAAFIKAVRESADQAGTNAHYFTETDKGPIACVFLDKPDLHGDLFQSAREFMRRVQDSLKDNVSFGAAQGLCYVGSVGTKERFARTCIGPAVNTAHRLMLEARAGSTMIPKSDSVQWSRYAGLIHGGTLHCKGLNTPVSCMRISRYFVNPREAAVPIDGTVVHVLLDRTTKTSLSGFSSACASLLNAISMEAFEKPCPRSGMLDVAKKAGLASHHISAISTILALPGHDPEFRACPESGRIDFLAAGIAALLSAANRLFPIKLVFENIQEYSPTDTALARAVASCEFNPPIQIVCTSENGSLSLFSETGTAPTVPKITLKHSNGFKSIEPAEAGVQGPSSEDEPENIPLLVLDAGNSGQDKQLEACLLQGIRWAAAYFRNDEAIAWSQKLLATSPHILVKTEASLLLAQTLAHSGNQLKAAAAYSIALETAERSGSKESEAAVLCDLALLDLESRQPEKAEHLVEKLALMPGGVSPLLASRIHDTVFLYHYYLQDLVEARRIAEIQLTAAKAANEPLILAKAFASMAAVSLADRKDDAEPLLWLDQELAILQKTENLRMLEECYYSFSLAYQRRNEFKLALQYCNAYMDCAESMGDSAGFLSALEMRGKVKIMLERYEEAIKDFSKLGTSADKSGNPVLSAEAQAMIGLALSYLGKPDEALPRYLDSYKTSRKSGTLFACSVAASAIGRIYHDHGETKKALAFLETELKLTKESGDALGKGLAYGDIGIILGDEGKTDKALECINFSINICSGHTVPAQSARLLLHKAFCILEKTTASNTPPTQADKEYLTELCRQAGSLSSGACDPAIMDIPWKAKILEARIAGGDSMLKLLASVPPDSLRAADKALYHFEMSLLEPDHIKAAGHLASATKLDTRLVNKYARFYARIGVIPATGSAS